MWVSFWSTSCAKTVGHCSEKRFGGVGAAEVDPDTAGGDADGGSDFEQVGADGAALGPGMIGAGQADGAQGMEDHIGERCEPLTQMVGPQRGCGDAIGEETELLFFDTIFHVTPGTVPRSVTCLRIVNAGAARQVGDDEARVGLGLLSTVVDSGGQRFGLRADQALSRPGLTGLVRESVIGGAGLVVAAGKGQSGRKVPGYGRLQTGIGRQSEDKTDVIRFAPGQQIVSAQSGITTDDEARSMPAMATTKTLDNGGDCVDAVATGVRIAGLQFAPHHMPGIRENVQRRRAMAVVLAIEPRALLIAVNRASGGVKIENDLLRESRLALLGIHIGENGVAKITRKRDLMVATDR